VPKLQLQLGHALAFEAPASPNRWRIRGRPKSRRKRERSKSEKQPAAIAFVLLRYLQQLDTPRLVLWCYAIWYGVVFFHYFDPSPALWLTSVGLSGIIGCALLLSTRAAIGTARLGGWGIFRLFLMPFCVSSFAALVKGRGFVLVFAPRLGENLLVVALCGGFVGLVCLLRRRRGATQR
jgi:hypothetical protein